MPSVLEKFTWSYITENCPPGLLAGLILFMLTIWLVLRINKVITHAADSQAEQVTRIILLEKQQRKLEQTISSAPCVTKNNGLWLQDSKRNGGQPPEPIKCQYLAAKERGEK